MGSCYVTRVAAGVCSPTLRSLRRNIRPAAATGVHCGLPYTHVAAADQRLLGERKTAGTYCKPSLIKQQERDPHCMNSPENRHVMFVCDSSPEYLRVTQAASWRSTAHGAPCSFFLFSPERRLADLFHDVSEERERRGCCGDAVAERNDEVHRCGCASAAQQPCVRRTPSLKGRKPITYEILLNTREDCSLWPLKDHRQGLPLFSRSLTSVKRYEVGMCGTPVVGPSVDKRKFAPSPPPNKDTSGVNPDHGCDFTAGKASLPPFRPSLRAASASDITQCANDDSTGTFVPSSEIGRERKLRPAQGPNQFPSTLRRAGADGLSENPFSNADTKQRFPASATGVRTVREEGGLDHHAESPQAKGESGAVAESAAGLVAQIEEADDKATEAAFTIDNKLYPFRLRAHLIAPSFSKWHRALPLQYRKQLAYTSPAQASFQMEALVDSWSAETPVSSNRQQGQGEGSVQRLARGGLRTSTANTGTLRCSDRKRKVMNGTEYIRRKTGHGGKIRRVRQAPAYKRKRQ